MVSGCGDDAAQSSNNTQTPCEDADVDGVCDDVDVCAEGDDAADADADGTPDGCDACLNDLDNDADQDGVCGDVDVCAEGDDALDADSDGTPDGCDSCPADADNDADADGVCGDLDVCADADDALDTDADGTPDGCDACPADPDDDVDADGVCGDVDACADFDDALDADADGTPDGCDICPADAFNDTVELCGQRPFSTDHWTFYATDTAADYPIVDQSMSELLLLPDNLVGAAAVATYNHPLLPPFEVEFDYSLFDDDSCADCPHSWQSGDGIALMFLKDTAAYQTVEAITSGGTRGFIADGTGYGVHFEIFEYRELIIADGNLEFLNSTRETDGNVYTNGEWQHVRVVVTATDITVYFNDTTLTWSGTLDTTYSGLAFSAGTGVSEAEHKLRNVVIRKLP